MIKNIEKYKVHDDFTLDFVNYLHDNFSSVGSNHYKSKTTNDTFHITVIKNDFKTEYEIYYVKFTIRLQTRKELVKEHDINALKHKIEDKLEHTLIYDGDGDYVTTIDNIEFL